MEGGFEGFGGAGRGGGGLLGGSEQSHVSGSATGFVRPIRGKKSSSNSH